MPTQEPWHIIRKDWCVNTLYDWSNFSFSNTLAAWLPVDVLCGSLQRACLFASVSSLLSWLNFLMGRNTLLDEIATYFVLVFLQTKAALTSKGEESQKSAMYPPSWKFRLSLKFINKLEPVPVIVLGSFKFSFSHLVQNAEASQLVSKQHFQGMRFLGLWTAFSRSVFSRHLELNFPMSRQTDRHVFIWGLIQR